MELLRLDGPLDDTLHDPIIVVALDGWTDAGRAGSLAAETIRAQWVGERVGRFDPDRLYDYRDRRPILTIDAGLLGDPVWPQLEVWQLSPAVGAPLLLLQGAEPDFSWQRLCGDIVELARTVGATRYVGLGAVPAPVPHTRVTPVITTASDEATLERYGRPHEQLTVPASCQVVIETALRDAGLTTLGLWARIPHYVAGDYPDGAHTLLRHLVDITGGDLDLAEVLVAADAHRQRLDLAASSSDDILEHIRRLERHYDEDIVADVGFGPLPTGDDIAAEFERFLRHQDDEESR